MEFALYKKFRQTVLYSVNKSSLRQRRKSSCDANGSTEQIESHEQAIGPDGVWAPAPSAEGSLVTTYNRPIVNMTPVMTTRGAKYVMETAFNLSSGNFAR